MKMQVVKLKKYVHNTVEHNYIIYKYTKLRKYVLYNII